MDQQILIEKIGLEPKEAKIYLTLLKNKPIGASTIARETNIKRTTVNDLLKKMVNLGLVKVIIFKTRKKYTSQNPLVIRNILRDKVDNFDQILPTLELISANKKRSPQIEYFEGKENLKKCYNDALSARTNILACTSPDNFYNIFSQDYAKEYVDKRVANKIFAKSFLPQDQPGKDFKKTDNQSLRKSKLINAEKYPITMEINIYDNKVMIASLTEIEPFGAIITSHEFAKTLGSIFRLAWDNIK